MTSTIVAYTDVAYLRISKDRVGKKLGVDRQKHDIIEARRRRGIDRPIQRWYSDNDISASDRRKNRPDYRQMLADIASGQIAPTAELWTWHTDRLHRQNTELEEFIDYIEKTRISIEPVTSSPLDLTTASGRMVARQLGAVAQYYAEHQSEQIRGKKKELARDGVPLAGGCPFGYLDGGIEINKAEAKLIEIGTDMVLAGRSLAAVAEMWNAAGAKRRRSTLPWRPSDVKLILIRYRNAGLLEHNGNVVGNGLWGRWMNDDKTEWGSIVTVEKLHAVRTLLNDPARNMNSADQTFKPGRLGSGLYLCGIEGCGRPLKVGVANGAKAYMCRVMVPSMKRVPGPHVVRNADKVDELIEQHIINVLSSYDEVRSGLLARSFPDIDVPAMRAEAARIEAEQRGLGSDVVAGHITREQMHAMNAGYMARLAEIDRTLASVVITSPAAEMACAPDVDKAWESAPLDVRRAVLKELGVVTILPSPKGRRGFLPEYVQWVPAAA